MATHEPTISNSVDPAVIWVGTAMGGGLAALGGVAVVASDIDGPLTQRIDLAGFGHSTAVGLVELVLGLLLLLNATRPSPRVATVVLGVIVAASGVALVSSGDDTLLAVGATRSTGWLAIGAGAIVALTARHSWSSRPDRSSPTGDHRLVGPREG